jgi:nucleoside-diphosphate-sugar epimerase
MLNPFKGFRWTEAIPRILADFAIVQFAALLSLLSAFLVRALGTPHLAAGAMANMVQAYYTHSFLPLSLIFPPAFFLSGFYTKSRMYTMQYKWRQVLYGSALATLVYLFVSFLTTRSGTLPRSSLVVFGFLVASGTVGIRWLKWWIVDTDESARARLVAGTPLNAPVLVVGGAGYIGSILVRNLLDSGRRVRILDSLLYGTGAIRDILDNPDLELVVGDCRNIQSVVSAVKGAESIVHLAAIVGDPACEQDRQTALEVNYAATRMLIEIAKGNGVARFVFASSCSVYGVSESVMDERSALSPISVYAQTKIDSERVLLEAKSESFHPTILRLATVFGYSYRPRFDLVVNLLAARAHHEETITIFNGSQWRPFLHVRDVAAGILEVLKAPVQIVSGEVFNLGDSRFNYTLAGVAEVMREVFPATAVEHVDNADRRNYRVSFDKVRNMVGFRNKVTLIEGIRELKEAFETGAVADYTDSSYHNQRHLEQSGSPANMNEVDGYVMAAFIRPAGSAVSEAVGVDAAKVLSASTRA